VREKPRFAGSKRLTWREKAGFQTRRAKTTKPLRACLSSGNFFQTDKKATVEKYFIRRRLLRRCDMDRSGAPAGLVPVTNCRVGAPHNGDIDLQTAGPLSEVKL